MYDIITVGSAVQDVFLQTKEFIVLKSKRFRTGIGECFSYGSKVDVERMFTETGGGATNTAVTFAHLGFRVSAFSYIGRDVAGEAIQRALEEYRIGAELLRVHPKLPTGQSIILMTISGDRTVLSHRGASAAFSARDLQQMPQTKWMYLSAVGGNLAFARALFSRAQKQKTHVAWNPGRGELDHGLRVLSSLIQSVDVLLVNTEEAAGLASCGKNNIRAMVKRLSPLPRRALAITDGEKGAYLTVGRKTFFAEALRIRRVNTTGAGDAFGSGFVAGLMLKDDEDFAFRLAMANSQSVIQKLGAKKGILTRLPHPFMAKTRIREF